MGALFYGVPLLVLLGLTAGLAQSLAKVSLDSTIQGGVPVRVQASAFARSDTTLQLAWVIGGFVGIAMPLVPALGLGVAFTVLAAWTVFVIVTAPNRATKRGPTPAQADGASSSTRHRTDDSTPDPRRLGGCVLRAKRPFETSAESGSPHENAGKTETPGQGSERSEEANPSRLSQRDRLQ